MANITFTNSGGLWENNKNWSGGKLPGSSDTAIIGRNVSVGMDGSQGPDEVGSIRIGVGADLEIDNQNAINKSSPAIFDNGGVNAGVIGIALQSTLTINGAFQNIGSIKVGEGGATDRAHADYLNLSSTAALTGGGTVVLRDGWIQAALTNVDNTVSGYGFMGNGDANGQKFALNNQGTIDATGVNQNGFIQNLVIQAGATVGKNSGLLEATNPTNAAVTGGLSLFGDTIDNVGGVIEATGAHTHVDLSSTTISGGTLETRQGGVVTFDATSLLDGKGAHPLTIDGALVVTDGAYLNVAGHINLLAADDSDILLNSTGIRANLVIATTGAVLEGGGRVTLGGLSSDQILGAAAGATLTLADATLEGAGHIGGNLRIVNQKHGVIDANSTAGALVIDTNTLVFQSAGLLEATAGGALSLSETTIDDSAGGKLLATSNSTVTLEASTLIGGVMATSGTGAIQAHGVSVLDGRTSTITNQGLFRVIDGADLTIEGTISNTGTIALGDDNGANAIVRIGDVATLTGGGTFRLNDGADGKLVIGLASTSTLSNVDNTIIGAGQLGDGQLTLDNQANGVIDADRAGALVIDTSHGGSVTNDGLIEATGKGGLILTNTTVDNSGGGTFHAGNGAVLKLQTTTVTGGTFTTTGAGVIAGFASDTLDGRTSAIQNAGLFLVMDGGDVTIEGSIVNTGTLALGDHTGSNAFLRISPSTILTGGGTLKLNDGADGKFVVGQTAASTLTNVDNTISGAGQLGDTQLTLINQAKGVINANGVGALVIDTGSGSVTNAGLIEATGKGGLQLSNTTLDNSAGTILAAGSTVSLSTATVVGGLVESVGTGAVQVTLQSILDGRANAVTLKGHFNVLNNQTILVEGAIKNTGMISIQDAGSFTALRLAANTTLSGGGKLVLSDSSSNFVIGSSALTLTNVDNTISGAGQLSDTQMRLVNQSAGVIVANGANALVIESGAGQTTANDDVNAGLIEATGKGGLTIELTTIDESGGGTIVAGANSSVLLSLSELIGGTLKTNGGGVIDVQGLNILDGSKSTVSNLGNVKVLNAGSLEVLGKLSNSGAISLNGVANASTLLSINSVLSGGGTLNLGDSHEGIIEGATATETFTNVDNTISGAGLIGNGQMRLINQAAGVIDALGTPGIVIDTGSQTIANAGLIEVGAGSNVQIESAINNTGVLETNGGLMELDAKVVGAGSLLINSGTMEFTQANVANAVTFAGKSGVLQLDNSQVFSGSISGFSKTGGESLDLSDIAFASLKSVKFVENKAKTGGVLTVSDGTHTSKITLLGDYSGVTFTGAADDHDGTSISAGPPPASHAMVQAMAALGGGQAGAASPLSPAGASQPSLALMSGRIHGHFG